MRSYRPSLPPSPGRRLFFIIRSVLYYNFSKRDSLYSIFFLLFGDTILIFASVATTPDLYQDVVVLLRIAGFLLMGRIGTKYGRLEMRECGTWWMCICDEGRVVAFLSSSAVSYNAMGTSKHVFGAATIV